MNILAKSMLLVAFGAAGTAGGWYLASMPSPGTASSPVAASTELEPAAASSAKRAERPAQDGQTTELEALRSELRVLQAQVKQMPAVTASQARASAEQAARQESLKVFQEQIAASERKFLEEPVDPGFSREGSAGLQRLLQKYPPLSELGANVECRSASCRLTLPAGIGEEARESLMSFIQEAQGEFAQVEMFPDREGGNGSTMLYLSSAEIPDPGVDPSLQPRVTMLIGHSE